MRPLHLLPFILGGMAAVGVALVSILRSRRKSPEQLEQERRMRLSAAGRMTDGSVIEVQEYNTDGCEYQVLIYTYDVAGVCYEAAQDVTRLRSIFDLQTCRLGLPASIKYDPHNPGNSIVIAEGWSGLRF
jgi:hypothetical protein